MDTPADRLAPHAFRAFRKVMMGKAKVCTSFVDVPRDIDLGDCAIGSSTKGDLQIRNLSDLPCKIKLEFQSKILKIENLQAKGNATSTERMIDTVPARATKVYSLEISPMRINPNYCKQITVENLTNRNNDQFVNVRARNVDSNRVSLHNLFYLVRSRHPSNSICFDTLVTNSPQIRSFTLRNITDKPITVCLTPSLPDAIRLFLEPADSNAPAAARGGGGGLGGFGGLKQDGGDVWLMSHMSQMSAVRPGESPGIGPLGGGHKVAPFSQAVEEATLLSKRGSSDDEQSQGRGMSPSSRRDSRNAFQSPLPEATPAQIAEDEGRLNPRAAAASRRKRCKSMTDVGRSGRHDNILAPSVRGTGRRASPRRSRRPRRDRAADVGESGPGIAPNVSLYPGASLAHPAAGAGAGGGGGGEGRWSPPRRGSASAAMADGVRGGGAGEGKFSGSWAELKNYFESSSFGHGVRYFNTPEEERSYIKRFEMMTGSLEEMILTRVLQPVQVLTIPANTSVSLVCVFQAPNSVSNNWKDGGGQAGKIRSLDTLININLLEYDKALLTNHMTKRLVNFIDTSAVTEQKKEAEIEIPQRTLPIIAKVCQSMMEVAQRHINFGTVITNNEYSKKLVVKNLSDVPLMYRIEKTKNWVAQAFMNFDNQDAMGVIKPHGIHERDFHFHPKMWGKFLEVLTIRNLQDAGQVVEITVKAYVRKRETFHLAVSGALNTLGFGRCKALERSKMQRIELHNFTHSPRSVMMTLGHLSLVLECNKISLPDSVLIVNYTFEECTVGELKVNKEDELEAMHRKLKIYIRKGKHAKAAKLKEKIQALQGKPIPDELVPSSVAAVMVGSPDNSDDSLSTTSEVSAMSDLDYSSQDESDAEDEWTEKRTQQRRQEEKESRTKNQCAVQLKAHAVQTLLLTVTLQITMADLRDYLHRSGGAHLALTADSMEGEVADLVVSGCIVAHEKANEDSKKVLPFSLSWAADDVQEDNDRDFRDFDTPGEGAETSGRDADVAMKSEAILSQRHASLSEPPGVGGWGGGMGARGLGGVEVREKDDDIIVKLGARTDKFGNEFVGSRSKAHAPSLKDMKSLKTGGGSGMEAGGGAIGVERATFKDADEARMAGGGGERDKEGRGRAAVLKGDVAEALLVSDLEVLPSMLDFPEVYVGELFEGVCVCVCVCVYLCV
jgi:predicted transposase YbfD/YdcC